VSQSQNRDRVEQSFPTEEIAIGVCEGVHRPQMPSRIVDKKINRLLLVSEAPFDDLQLLKLDQICHADFHACHFCAGRLPAGSAYRHAGRR